MYVHVLKQIFILSVKLLKTTTDGAASKSQMKFTLNWIIVNLTQFLLTPRVSLQHGLSFGLSAWVFKGFILNFAFLIIWPPLPLWAVGGRWGPPWPCTVIRPLLAARLALYLPYVHITSNIEHITLTSRYNRQIHYITINFLIKPPCLTEWVTDYS